MRTTSKIQLVRYVQQGLTVSGALAFNEEVYATLDTMEDAGKAYTHFKDYIETFLKESFGAVIITEYSDGNKYEIYKSNYEAFMKEMDSNGVKVLLMKTITG